jgi:recombinase-like protein
VVDYNPFLHDQRDGLEKNKGDADSIETYVEPALIPWQSRAALPDAYETALGDALEAIFSEEIYALDRIVRRLNDDGLKTPDGKAWTEASFKAEMARLAGDEI